MAYALEARMFVENGPVIHAVRARSLRSSRAALTIIRSEGRRAANDDLADGYPIAL